jgi:tetratricopeptide (TPR) repeat protein
MRSFRSVPTAVCLTLLLAPLPAAAQHEHGPGGQEGVLGEVSFPVSCAPGVQEEFNRAAAMLHSFWFEQADAAFQAVAQADPGCAMAWWGRAMTLWGNPMTRVAPSEPRAREALAAVERARSLAAGATPREQAWIEAAAALYEGAPERDHLARMRAHEDALAEIVERWPDDLEAAIFYGRAVVANAPPADLTFSRQLHAAAVMEPLFLQRPDHPGLAHYLIHAFDAPALAAEGLEAARRYADIAPAAPHALHMPSHIFTRMGYWEESIELNDRSARAEPNPDAAVHPLDYMVYAYLQLGRDREAGGVVNRARDIPDEFYGGLLGYNFAAMQTRFALERDRWEEAAVLRVPEGAAPFVQAIPRFGRALGQARLGRGGDAALEVRAMEELVASLEGAGDSYWATVVGAQALAAAAWVARAEGRDDDALRLAREASALEGTVEKHPVTPGPLLPARELEGDLLRDLGRPADALAAYEETLEKEPRRARALYGAARAAEEAGLEDRARVHYAALLELLEAADPDRPEPAAARRFLARR